jgi:urease accessory protein
MNPLLHCSKLMSQGRGLARVLVQRASTITLDWDTRQKSRFDATDSAGRQLGIFLPRGTVVRGGDVLVAEDGSLIRVEAAPQDVLRITACTEHGSPFDLTRAAYHLGNRHVPIELKPDHLKIEPDHVLADMLRAMHMTVVAVSEPFEPESGAYGDQSGHSHGGHGHHHDHAHSHEQSIAAEPHVHGPDCQHGHSAPASAPAQAKRIPVAIPIRSAPATPHVHGPDCKHEH